MDEPRGGASITTSSTPWCGVVLKKFQPITRRCFVQASPGRATSKWLEFVEGPNSALFRYRLPRS